MRNLGITTSTSTKIQILSLDLVIAVDPPSANPLGLGFGIHFPVFCDAPATQGRR